MSGRRIEVKKVRDVGRSKTSDRFETDESNFVFNSLVNR